MLVIALLLLILAVLMTLAALFGGSDPTSLDLGSFNLDASAGTMFFLGVATLAVFLASLLLFRSSARRARARRADRKKVGELSDRLEAYRRDEDEDRHDADRREP